MIKSKISAKIAAASLAWMFLLSARLASQVPTANQGSKHPITFEHLSRNFAQPDMIYAPFTFWFWDEPLHPEKMARMAEKMLEQNLNPGYAHGRMAMVGTPDLPRRQWLSPVWFDAFDKVLQQAKEIGGYFGYVDEYWWPSGRAAGRVLKENPELWAVSLFWLSHDIPGGVEVKLPASFFTVAARRANPIVFPDNKPILAKQIKLPLAKEQKLNPYKPVTILSKTLRLIGSGDSFTWKAPPDGSWRVYTFRKYYHPGADGGRLNYLDERLSDAFIKLAHVPYARRFPEQMGRLIPGVFVDNEGDYGYKLAWSANLARRYKRQYNRDIRLWMPLMFDFDKEGRWAQARWDWFEVVSDIYTEYLGGTSHWLAKHGMYCISNLWEETLMWQAGAVGDFFKAQRAYSLPGTDCLGHNGMKCHDFRETQSVSEFEGRRFQSEIMGAAGWWGFSPVAIKQLANSVITWGVSHVVPHGIFTTRKLDGNPWLPDWFEENPLWPYLHLWTDFVRRASFINSQGHLVPDVLLVNPMDSVWALSGPGAFDPALGGRVPVVLMDALPTSKDIPRSRAELKRNSAWWCPPLMDNWFNDQVRRINQIYSQAMVSLTKYRIEYLIADRHYLRQMQIKGNRLIRGHFTFQTVILPPLVVLPLDVAEKITAFAQAGGHVYALGSLPTGSTENGMNDTAMAELMRKLQSAPTFQYCPGDIESALKNHAPGLVSQIQFLDGPFSMLQQHRRIDNRDFYWLANNTGKEQSCRIHISNVSGAAQIWDCETGKIRPISSSETDSGSNLNLHFDAYEGYWLVMDPSAKPANTVRQNSYNLENEQPLTGKWLVYINPAVQPPLEHPYKAPAEFVAGTEKPLQNWDTWGLKPFSGHIDYWKSIKISKTAGHITLDLGKVCYMAELWVNGELIGQRLWPPYRFDLTGKLNPQTNQIHIRVGNLINNSYNQPQESGLIGPVTLLYQK